MKRRRDFNLKFDLKGTPMIPPVMRVLTTG